MYASTSFQNIRITEASTFAELESVPFTIKFVGTEHGANGDVCFHLGNAPLAVALVKAINDVVAEYGVSLPEILPAPTPPDDGEILF